MDPSFSGENEVEVKKDRSIMPDNDDGSSIKLESSTKPESEANQKCSNSFESPQPKKKPLEKMNLKKATIHDESSYDLEDSPAQVLERFKRGCECQDDQCFKGLNPETVYRHRLNIAELTKPEHDMYLMGVTMACLTNPYQTARQTKRRRLRAQYVYQGRRVCLDAFLYLENCTHYQIKRIRKHLITHGVTPRVHGNHGKVPHNTFSFGIYKMATEFLKMFVEAQEAKFKTKAAKNSPIHLTSDLTRKIVYDQYTKYCKETTPEVRVMGYSTFRRFMKVQFPQVRFPRLDLTVRQQTVQGQATRSQDDTDKVDRTELIDDGGALLPFVIANETGQSGAYLLTHVDNAVDGVEYQTTTGLAKVNAV